MDFLSTYSYFLGSIYFFVVWLMLYLAARPHNRKEMIHLSIGGAAVGLLFGPIYNVDWWNPTSLYNFQLPFTNLNVAVEDIIFGFLIFGIAAVIFEVLTAKQELFCRGGLEIRKISISLGVLIFSAIAVFLSVYVFNLHSLLATLVGAVIISVFIYYRRPDLLKASVGTVVLLAVIAIPSYLLPMIFNPQWIQAEWYLNNLSNYFVLGIPIEEFIWYAAVALVASNMWEYSRSIYLFSKSQ